MLAWKKLRPVSRRSERGPRPDGRRPRFALSRLVEADDVPQHRLDPARPVTGRTVAPRGDIRDPQQRLVLAGEVLVRRHRPSGAATRRSRGRGRRGPRGCRARGAWLRPEQVLGPPGQTLVRTVGGRASRFSELVEADGGADHRGDPPSSVPARPCGTTRALSVAPPGRSPSADRLAVGAWGSQGGDHADPGAGWDGLPRARGGG